MTPPRNFDEPEAFYSDDPEDKRVSASRKKKTGLYALVILSAGAFSCKVHLLAI